MMQFSSLLLAFLAGSKVSAGTKTNAITDGYVSSDCPLLGPDMPVPTALSSSSHVKQVIQNFPQALSSGTYGTISLANVSFSASVFSAADNKTLYTLYNTADSVKSAPMGVKQVDGDSIFRLGSISKLLTAYAFLMEVGDTHWSDPITHWIPELAQAQANYSQSTAIDHVQWDEVTLGELASHMAGITRDATLGDLSANGLSLGPKLPSTSVPTCGATTTQAPCSRSDFFQYLLQHHPSLPTSGTTPAYSNTGFALLAYALEAICKTSMQSVMQKLFSEAGMSSAAFNTSSPETGVIPFGNQSLTWWNVEAGNEAAAGGYFASNNDMIKLGQSILHSSIISPAMTRRWMKPDALVSGLNMAVGKPWEIRRIKDANNKVTDYYTKEGELGAYSSFLVLSPDYQVGMAINVADNGLTLGDNLHVVADALVGEFMPAIQATAHDQATQNYGGTYTSKATNSSVSISTDSRPGLKMSSLSLGGKDVLALLGELQGQEQAPSARLYPTGLTASSPGKNGGSYVSRVGYKAVYQVLPVTNPEEGAFGTNCETWTMIDSNNYGLVGLDEVEFGLGESGEVESVSLRALGVIMSK